MKAPTPKLRPGSAAALNQQAEAELKARRFEAAERLFARSLSLDGNQPIVAGNLGNFALMRGDLAQALPLLRKAVDLAPAMPELQFNLGNVLRRMGEAAPAIDAYRRAIALRPDFVAALLALAGLLAATDEAAGLVERAVTLQPGNAQAQASHAATLRRLSRFEDAVAAARRAVALAPAVPEAQLELGLALDDAGRLEAAVAPLRRAIALKPDWRPPYAPLVLVLMRLGRVADLVEILRQAVAARPADSGLHSALLHNLHYLPDLGPQAIFDAHQDWAGRHAPTRPGQVRAPDRTAGRRLRVGYVSPDLREHSVAYFLEPLLEAHDRAAFELFCYSGATSPDATTARLKTLVDHWVETLPLDDAALASRIEADRIDILVDLAGHTDGNRLTALARRPAPVQVIWLGYPDTTGMAAMDWRLSDAAADPPGLADRFCVERIWRLPAGFHCYRPPTDSPAPSPPPLLAEKAVTFGSYNSLVKVNDAVVDAWARILAAVPGSRLLLKGSTTIEPARVAAIQAVLTARGIALDRFQMLRQTRDPIDHLAQYRLIDIGLDPFPYNGTTTTCEALWMGVPVVSMEGDRHAGRVGVSLLGQVGLADLVAPDLDGYVRIAAALADDAERLVGLRQSLRATMAASPLTDAPGFARRVEAAYRGFWRDWLVSG